MTQLGGYNRNVRDALGYVNVADPSSPDTFFRRNLPRAPLDDLAAALTDGVMTSVGVYLHAGDVITNLSFLSGATAGAGPANWWFALYDNSPTPALLAQTANQAAAAWAANTVKTLALSAAQTIKTSGIYWAAVMFDHNAGALPSLVGALGARPIVTGERNLAQTSGAGLTTTAPATIAAPAVQNSVPLVVLT
ncbi:MAG: hypothetical protein HOV79_00510 [Hamadaea sp.]|nr:hypothetical protein [Hamadaea sp.]